MSAPIRYLLCGKSPAHLKACINISKPEFEVFKTASSVEDAKNSAVDLLNTTPPSITFIAMGAGFSKEDFEEVHALSKNVPWFRPIVTSPDYTGPRPTGPPSSEEISTRLRKAMDDHSDEIRAGKGAEEVWYF